MVSTCKQTVSELKRLGFKTERETETMAETGYMCRRQENTLMGEHLILRTYNRGKKWYFCTIRGFFRFMR